MRLDLEKVRIYAKKADNKALIDRVTLFQSGMEPEALEIIILELTSRGISALEITEHEEKYKEKVIRGPEGMPRLCNNCPSPATAQEWGWLKVFGFVPIIPWKYLFCEDHKTSHK